MTQSHSVSKTFCRTRVDKKKGGVKKKGGGGVTDCLRLPCAYIVIVITIITASPGLIEPFIPAYNYS